MSEDLKQQVAALDGKMQVLVDLTKDVLKTSQSVSERTGRVEANQETMARKIDVVHKAIYEGNGQPAIMQRLTVLETTVSKLAKDMDTNVSTITKDIKSLVDNLDGVKNGKMLSRTQIIAGAIGMFVAALSGVGALLSAIIK